MRNPFQSARLIYRAVESTDVDFIHSLNTNADNLINANFSLLRPRTHKSSEGIQQSKSEALLGVVICLPSPSEADNSAATPIGTPHLKSDMQHHRNAYLGINMSAAYQGKGYGSEAIRWALNWAFQMAGLHRVELSVFEWNEGARRLYEKLGFVAEGRQRQALWFDGRWWDMLYFGLLEEEWREKAEVVKLIE
ncbi:putative GNAT family acetyltransferase [Athelia psychrophila]|uniref:GNAT family acetyltransferase n=1 Tax=Athelia psychrophila TaxID=1759441 RepID=A0A166TKB9_9AGAM|nr:putative GNAT family acetyltransferase [Fibularhizoctonia sp. CBS 109695]